MTSPIDSDARWLTAAEAAQQLNVSTKTIRRRIISGELRAHRFGKSVRISQANLDQAMTPVQENR